MVVERAIEDLTSGVGDGVALRRGKDNEELIEGSESLEEGPKCGDGLTVARQQTQDVRVEREAPEAEARHEDEHQRPTDHQYPPAVGPRDDELDR